MRKIGASIFISLALCLACASRARADANVAPAIPNSIHTVLPDNPSGVGKVGALRDSADDSLENQPIDSGPGAGFPAEAKPGAPSPTVGTFDMVRVVLTLAGVVGFILLLRAGSKYFFPGIIHTRSTGAMKVLSRCTISPRQHLLLVQIGKRLLVVGDSGSQLNGLCEIRNPNEVAELVGQLREETIGASRRFDLFFGRARKNFDDDLNSQSISETLESPEEKSIESTTDSFDSSHEINDPALAATQKEISGLSAKVRDLAHQLAKS